MNLRGEGGGGLIERGNFLDIYQSVQKWLRKDFAVYLADRIPVKLVLNTQSQVARFKAFLSGFFCDWTMDDGTS